MANLYGTIGADSIVGSSSEADYISGGPAGNESADVGNDTLVGNAYDTLEGWGGNDSLSGGGYLYGGVGNDTIVGSWALDGDDGDDLLVGQADIRFPENYHFGSGLSGGSGNDTLYGSAENDGLDDGGADGDADVLSAGAGDDNLFSRGGVDTLDGGSGNDLAYIFRDTLTAGFRFTPSDAATAYTASDGTLIVNVERFYIYGGHGDDTLSGLQGVTDFFLGGAGNDMITGGVGAQIIGDEGGGPAEGNDTLSVGEGGYARGEGGDDYLTSTGGGATLVGGDGADTIVAGGMFGSSLNGGDKADSLVGGVGNDTLFDSDRYGEDAADTLLGGLGDDHIRSLGGADRIDGGGGRDTLELSGRGDLTTSFVLKLKGMKATTTASDGTTITGIEDIYVTGGSGRDKLTGNRGDDTLSGGTGYATGGEKDVLTGGDGADAFRWDTVNQLGYNQPKNVADTVTDFVVGTDRLEFSVTATGYLLPTGALDPSHFALNAATAAAAQFVFNTANDTLYWDADGTGHGKAVAVGVFAGITLSAADIFILL